VEDAVPNPVRRALPRWSAAVARGLRHAWAQSEAAQEAIFEINTPWRHDGPLRWRPGNRGWELHGTWPAVAPIEPGGR
jgi:hypothetical protein